MTRLNKAMLALCCTGLLTACGQQGGMASVSDAPVTDHGPTIDWDAPVVNAEDAQGGFTSSELASLPFKPIVPKLGVSPKRVQVTRSDAYDFADRGVGFIYDLPSDWGFTSDGHVYIRETLADANVMPNLRQAAAQNASPDSYTMETLGGHEALFIAGKDSSRVITVIGNVRIDVLGPAISASSARRIANAAWQ